MGSLSGKIAIVTGGGQGIGRSVAERLAREGAPVAVWDLDLSGATETVRAIASLGVEGEPRKVDVASWEEVKAAVETVVQRWGRIDILVNNAGVTRDGLLVRMQPADWEFVLSVNLNGTFHCTKAVLPVMIKQRSGRIVNLASVVGAMGNAGQANYAASKAAVIGFTKSVAREYAARNITANAVAPGFIDTLMTRKLPEETRESLKRQIPLGRLGQPEDVAHAVGFLVSEEASYITGQVLHVNGGMLMA